MRLRAELWSKQAELESLEAIRFHRVIDNAPITMQADDFWIQLNYQLIHLIDFLPVANWSVHSNDTAFIIFRDLYAFLERAGKLMARIEYTPASASSGARNEEQGVGAKLVSFIPVKLSEKMAAKSVRRFSEQINHSMSYEIVWRT